MFLRLRLPAIISFVLVLPFMILEVASNIDRLSALSVRRVIDFAVLSGILWLLPVATLLISMPVVRTLRLGNSIAVRPGSLLIRVAFSALMVAMWVGVVIDQLPCFLGMPNCD